MRLYLVHHADAVGPEVDPQRPLSAAGEARAERLAAEVKARGAAPAAIWHSGKLRARQTGEAMWRACSPFASFTMVRGLRPDDSPGFVRDALVGESHDLMIVGHMPNLSALIELLTGDKTGMPPHGAVALERVDGKWIETWRVAGSA